MGKIHYKSYSQGEISLFPPSIDEMVQADSPLRVVSNMVGKLNLQLRRLRGARERLLTKEGRSLMA